VVALIIYNRVYSYEEEKNVDSDWGAADGVGCTGPDNEKVYHRLD
jgi:hypothetical protein